VATLTLSSDRYSELRPGDVITALDGHPLPEPALVTATLRPIGGGTAMGVLLQPVGSTERYLYQDSLCVVTVERPEPGPKPKRMGTRIVDGVRFTSDGQGTWTAGPWSIAEDDALTTCENPHPVKLTPALVEWARVNPGQRGATEIQWAAARHARGYVCPGHATHLYRAGWIALHDLTAAQSEPGRLAEVVAWVAEQINRREARRG
jgi:hypothetical protein